MTATAKLPNHARAALAPVEARDLDVPHAVVRDIVRLDNEFMVRLVADHGRWKNDLPGEPLPVDDVELEIMFRYHNTENGDRENELADTVATVLDSWRTRQTSLHVIGVPGMPTLLIESMPDRFLPIPRI